MSDSGLVQSMAASKIAAGIVPAPAPAPVVPAEQPAQAPTQAAPGPPSSDANGVSRGQSHGNGLAAKDTTTVKGHDSRPASAREPHWLTHGVEYTEPSTSSALVIGASAEGCIDTGSSQERSQMYREREERIRALKERQLDERQRKLEELKQQAVAAQKFREVQEEERRRRMEDLRNRDSERRNQVEERKRQIMEAEQERREAILRKNQERDVRMEMKRRNERSSGVFAFGSSTPRLLEPLDNSAGPFWGTRKATSTVNITSVGAAPASRRSSERELDGSKKRATSAHGLDRKADEGSNGFLFGPPTCGRRKTDLMPTIPSPREGSSSSTRAPHSGRSPGMRSGDATPSPSRPHSALSQQSLSSHSSSVSLRAKGSFPRRPRPFSIAGTGISGQVPVDAHKEREGRASEKRTVTSAPAHRAHSAETDANKSAAKPPMSASRKAPPTKTEPKKTPAEKIAKVKPLSAKPTPKATPLQSPAVEKAPEIVPVNNVKPVEVKKEETIGTTTEEVVVKQEEAAEQTNKEGNAMLSEDTEKAQVDEKESEKDGTATTPESVAAAVVEPSKEEDLMSASMDASGFGGGSKGRITTEEEAKAALAERRRLAREQAEREAELERIRLEEEARAEEERIRREEEEQRRMEEEMLRLDAENRKAEQERLQKAIEENQRREEEERLRREEEARQRAEREEAEKKAREEAEKLRQEMEERLRKEEEERQLRRKRVEAIMSRTRGKSSTPGKELTDSQDSIADKESTGSSNDVSSQHLDDQMETPKAPSPATSEPVLQSDAEALIVTSQEVQEVKETVENVISEEPAVGSLLSLSDGSNSLNTVNSTLSTDLKPMETSEDFFGSVPSSVGSSLLPSEQRNGHKECINNNGKQLSNMLDLTDFETFNNGNASETTVPSSDLEQLLDLIPAPAGGTKLVNEDNVNFNVVTTNGPPTNPFAFEDGIVGKKGDNAVPDLLS